VEPTAEAAVVFFIHCARAWLGEELLEHVYVLLRADVLELLRPYGDGHLPEVSCAQKVHEGPGLPDSSSNAEGNPVVEDGLVVGKIKKVLLA
jgi:hypothetical protein